MALGNGTLLSWRNKSFIIPQREGKEKLSGYHLPHELTVGYRYNEKKTWKKAPKVCQIVYQ